MTREERVVVRELLAAYLKLKGPSPEDNVERKIRAALAAPSPAAEAGEREAALREALADARNALDRDRTGLAAALNAIRAEVAGRYWMEPDGGWANYSWEEHTADTLRKEIGWAFAAITKIAKDALCASGTLATVGVRAASEALAAAPAAPPPAARLQEFPTEYPPPDPDLLALTDDSSQPEGTACRECKRTGVALTPDGYCKACFLAGFGTGRAPADGGGRP